MAIENELEKHLKLMHLLASVFAVYKNEPLLPSVQSSTDKTEDRPETKAPRFTALRAKLEAHNKEHSTSSELGVSDAGVSQG